jgi:lysophospholipase L1-like esterase
MAAFDGNGNYIRSFNWSNDATNGIDITASRCDTEDNGFASGLSLCLTRDGQGKMQTHFIPGTASAYDVGSVGVPWRNVYCSQLNATTIVGNIISTGVSYPQTPTEQSAGVTPASPQWPAYDIRRYAATVGNGVVSDNAVFATAKSIAGSQAIFLPSLGYKWNLSTFTDGNFISDGTLLFVGTGYVKYKTLQGNSINDNNVSIAGIHWNAPQIVILGDSITEGTGAPTIQAGYSFGVARSIMNAVNNGWDYDPGFGYHTTVNLQDAITMGEISTTGTVVGTGLVGNRISLAAGQSITITGKSVVSIDVIYDGAVSSGNIVFALNGTTYATKATSGAVLNNTFQTLIRTSNGIGACTNESDSITISASGGTVVITSLISLKTSSGGPLVFVAPQSGTTYGDFTAAAKITELAYYLNFARSSNEKLLILALGTNSIYNAGKATTPAAMITAIASIVSQVSALCSNLRFAIHIPPRAAEGTFPVITTGVTHAEYVNALEDYARTNNVTLIRHDRSALSYGNLYSDGLHPNSQGHRIMAKNVCDTLGITFNPYLKTALNDFQFNNQIDVPYNSTWRSFSNASANRVVATRVGNDVKLSGIAEPNGSVSTTIAVLPAGYRPVGRTCFYTGRSDVGTFAAGLSIDTSGNIICAAVPASWFSLEGISFTISRP